MTYNQLKFSVNPCFKDFHWCTTPKNSRNKNIGVNYNANQDLRTFLIANFKSDSINPAFLAEMRASFKRPLNSFIDGGVIAFKMTASP